MPQRHESAPVLLDSSSNSARILLVGDTHLAENYFAEFSLGEGKANILDMHGYDYGFDGVRAFLESSDYVIADLETPVTDLPSSPLEGKKKSSTGRTLRIPPRSWRGTISAQSVSQTITHWTIVCLACSRP